MIPYKMKDIHGCEFWWTPVGTWVEMIVYEDFTEIGIVAKMEYNPETDVHICELEDGTSPWNIHCVRPLTKLERALK